MRWGILATGAIARTFARQLVASGTGEVALVASRDAGRAESLVGELGAGGAARGYHDLVEAPEVEAVYIATPHPQHVEWAVQAAPAGKHVLCEKPLGINHAEAMAAVDAAAEHGTFLMEGYAYRAHPQTRELRELIAAGAIGEVRHVQATFGFAATFDPDGRLFSNALAGGGILDVGGYPVSMARLIAGAASGRPFADPERVSAHGRLGETGVDLWSAAQLDFPGGLSAHVAAAVDLELDNRVVLHGSRGRIVVPSPWLYGGRDGGRWEIRLERRGKAPETIAGEESQGLFAIEAALVAREIAGGARESPAMTWADSLGNAETLDTWRRELGLVLDAEKPDRVPPTVTRRALARREVHPMRYGSIAGVEKDVSRVVMGCDNQTEMPHAAVMFDHYFEHGGNAFDTAYVYARGWMEQIVGRWIRDRGVRDEVVLIGKGAHTPKCHPRFVEPELLESLERLRTDYVDVYFLHRDDPDVPVGEWVDVLNEQLEAGRCRAFGGSNWSRERVRAANDYARAHGRIGFAAVSNNFSLARMVEPVWPGCVAASTQEFRRLLAEEGIALMPWSAQARGFFTERAERPAGEREVSGPAAAAGRHPRDEEMARCWFSDDNFERRARAIALAAERGVEPINVALAYVLAQPFATFPLIGPRTLAETRSSLRALDVALGPEEVEWLDLRRDRR